MIKAATILCIGALLTTACEQRAAEMTAALDKRVQTIEQHQAALQQQAEGLALKTSIASGLLHRSPLEDFFASPEFWEKTYDSGQADCARRCIKANQQHRAACAQLTDAAARQKCYDEALQRVTACQRGCVGL